MVAAIDKINDPLQGWRINGLGGVTKRFAGAQTVCGNLNNQTMATELQRRATGWLNHNSHPRRVARVSARSVMIVEVRRHVLVYDRSISPVNELLEMVSDEPLHLIRRQVGCHGCSYDRI